MLRVLVLLRVLVAAVALRTVAVVVGAAVAAVTTNLRWS